MEEIIECLKIITKSEGRDAQKLKNSLLLLDSIVKNSTISIHPRLKHFLQNRSYEKALIWIEGGTPKRGVCNNE